MCQVSIRKNGRESVVIPAKKDSKKTQSFPKPKQQVNRGALTKVEVAARHAALAAFHAGRV